MIRWGLYVLTFPSHLLWTSIRVRLQIEALVQGVIDSLLAIENMLRALPVAIGSCSSIRTDSHTANDPIDSAC
jgi:hypothetical protein